ncbi:hypothetical protein ACOSP7_013225 [Xanthoceras sorbifolium]
MVTATRVIDIDLEFDEPATRVVDDTTERASVGKASTSGAMAPIILVGNSRFFGISHSFTIITIKCHGPIHI